MYIHVVCVQYILIPHLLLSFFSVSISFVSQTMIHVNSFSHLSCWQSMKGPKDLECYNHIILSCSLIPTNPLVTVSVVMVVACDVCKLVNLEIKSDTDTEAPAV